jgi:hypothetical protein
MKSNFRWNALVPSLGIVNSILLVGAPFHAGCDSTPGGTAMRTRPSTAPSVSTEVLPLEPRRMLAVTFSINAAADVHPISRYIYGINQEIGGNLSGATQTRQGGNRWTAYNWENNASNAGSDWQYQNDNFLVSGPAYSALQNTPGGAVTPTLNNNRSRNAGSIITIPMAGYVSADKLGNGDVRNSGANYLSTRFNQGVARKNAAFSLTPNLSDDFVYADEYVNWIKTNYPQTDPNKPIWFSLDNEPDLWANTHAEVHPSQVTYAEMVSRSTEYASAIKDVMPDTKVFGFVSYGWNGYTTLQNAPDANGRDFINFYLSQMKQASTAAGKRLIDVLDLHWYPEAQGGGVRITENNNTAAVVAARLQAPRSLWDPTYTETSWITQYSTQGPINLLTRIKAKIAANYPGTDLSITEYNYGGGNHISGGIAQADVLGIFGREGVFAANEWPLNGDESYIAGGFRMFRNYDGNGSNFGDTSIRAATSDATTSSVYASIDSSDPNVMTIVAINKTAAANTANINLAGRAFGTTFAPRYQLTSASATPQNTTGVTVTSQSGFSFSMPAYSVSTIRVQLAPVPVSTSSVHEYETSPNVLRFRFNSDVSASLSPSDLTIQRIGGGTISASGVTFSGTDALFTLPTGLVDGEYVATLHKEGVADSNGVPLSADATLNFFSLAGDVNRDRSVNFDDLLIVAQNYGQAGRSFSQGNLDYDSAGNVDFDDLLLLAQHYNTTLVTSSPVAKSSTARRSGAMIDLI